MPRGTLEVFLAGAHGLDSHFFHKIDPYVILNCRDQEHKSAVVNGGGSKPEWNATFLFSIAHGTNELHLKIMDKDKMSSDDFVGEATISLDRVFSDGNVPPQSYKVYKHHKHHGDITVALKFFLDPVQSEY